MSATEIFDLIHNEEQACQRLPKRKGNLKVQIVSRKSNTNNSIQMKQVYCYLRNKQFKFFKDNTMMEMEGIIDFDLV